MADLGAVGKLIFDVADLHGGQISGTVLGPGGTPVLRRVVAMDRVTGQRSGSALSNKTTGEYLLLTGIAFGKDPHTVIEFDDAAGDSYNARVFDNVIPL